MTAMLLCFLLLAARWQTVQAWSPLIWRQEANITTESASKTTLGSHQASSLLPARNTTSAIGTCPTAATITITSISVSTVTFTPSTCPSASSPSTTASEPFTTVPPGYTAEEIPYPLVKNSTHYNPSPKWEAAHAKARAWLSGWTFEEKATLCTGAGWAIGRCVGNIPPIPSRNFTGLCLMDSPLAVRFADRVSAFPAGINVASTFDKDFIYARGYAMGQEFKGKGANVALGPMTNMGRVVAGGRNWEGFGGDPYLSGWATEMTVRGLQDAGVQATVKHYVGNEQERNRTTSSSNIDDRTMREIYTHPFLRAVAADVAAVMCSYNLVNGSWSCQNSKTLNGILKTDFGFQGYVMSDWTATHSGVLAVNNGEDMDMPGDVVFGSLTSFFGGNLSAGVNNGSIATDRLDDMAERIAAAYFLLDQDQDYPAVNFDSFRRPGGANNSHVNVQDDHYKLIRHIGAASTVLLKNVNNTLPLSAPMTLALVGQDLGPSWLGPNGYADRGGLNGTLAMGWGSGTAEFPYLIDPLQAITARARQDGTDIDWWFDNWDTDSAQTVATAKEVVIVGVNSDSGEYYIDVDGNIGDRKNLSAWYNGDNLIQAVTNVSSNVVVVVHSVGPMDMEAWIDNPNITAVLWAGLPGQESGNSLVDVLYGEYNPSGRLPYTVAKKREDYAADIIYVNTDSPAETNVNYTEGLNIDYRHFLAKNITPRFAFGYGMSYTKFNYTNLQVWEIDQGKAEKRSARAEVEGEAYWSGNATNATGTAGMNATGGVKVGAFLRDELQRPRWTVSADIQNVGNVTGCEVPQLYLAYPESAGEPPRVLRDFTRINLTPWQALKVSFNLSTYDISYWDVVSQDWVVPQGEFSVLVARNSMDEGVMGEYCFGGGC